MTHWAKRRLADEDEERDTGDFGSLMVLFITRIGSFDAFLMPDIPATMGGRRTRDECC
jgi:hypothetical protein